MKRRRRPRNQPSIVPFEAWTAGHYGYILDCVPCFGEANGGRRRVGAGLQDDRRRRPHGEAFGHRIEPVEWFVDHPWWPREAPAV
jgi:hypothetical protein